MLLGYDGWDDGGFWLRGNEGRRAFFGRCFGAPTAASCCADAAPWATVTQTCISAPQSATTAASSSGATFASASASSESWVQKATQQQRTPAREEQRGACRRRDQLPGE